MKRILLILLVFVSAQVLQGQRKSDLIAEVATLTQTIDSLETEISEAKRNERSSKTTAESLKAQVTNLKQANASLLESLNSFTKVSKKNTHNAQKALENLDKREEQINTITNVFASNDSLAIKMIGHSKSILGNETELGIGERFIAINYQVTDFFDDYKKQQLNETGKTNLQKLVSLFTKYPQYDIQINGLSNTGEYNLTGAQANIIAFELNQMGVALKRLSSTARDGGFKDGFTFQLSPKYDGFYAKVKEQLSTH